MASTAAKLNKIAEGREAEMFEWQDGKILRLFRGDFLRSTVEFQTNVLRDIAAAGVRVPQVYDITVVDGREGVIMERIEGTDLLTLIGKRPWKVWSVGRIAGRAQAEINGKLAPATLPTIHQRYGRQIENSPLVPDRYRAPALARLKRLPEGDTLVHGDFHPGNIMLQDEQPVILDWSNAARGVPEVDLGRTSMMMSLGDPPPGTPVLIRFFAKFARSILRNAHVNAYRKVRQVDDGLMKAWELPIAVARFAENIEAERPRLTRRIDSLLMTEAGAAP